MRSQELNHLLVLLHIHTDPVAPNAMKKDAANKVGGFLAGDYERSRLYAPDFSTEFRTAIGEEQS